MIETTTKPHQYTTLCLHCKKIRLNVNRDLLGILSMEENQLTDIFLFMRHCENAICINIVIDLPMYINIIDR